LLKRNLIANYLGQGWRAVMSLAFVPIYIKYLGIEAYGLIGIFAILMSALSLLDLGMKPALGREMARYSGGTHNEQSIWNLLRSIEIISIVIVITVALVIWLISDWLATSWVKAQTLPTPVVAQSFTIMGLVAALQFFESIYSSSLAGLQRQVIQNIIICSMATVRGLVAVGVLIWISPSIQAFFIWQVICSCINLIVCATVVYQSLPSPPNPARFSKVALLSVWRFASGMLVITILALLLTQVDKALLSSMLTLDSFGYYALASSIAGSLAMLVGPITAAYYPRFNQLIVMGDTVGTHSAYHQAAQLVTVIVGSATVMLFFFSERILFLWTSDPELSHKVAPIMAVLALGTFLNCLMWVPYQMQLAFGWTSLTVIINSVAVAILIPAIFVTVPIYGPIAAAWIWVILNGGYCLIGVHFMYKRILTTEKWAWYIEDIFQPMLLAGAVVLLLKKLLPNSADIMAQLGLLALASTLTIAASALGAKWVRQQIRVFAASFYRMANKKVRNL
jgi:O-antigen/teichoic acid export membrane protein